MLLKRVIGSRHFDEKHCPHLQGSIGSTTQPRNPEALNRNFASYFCLFEKNACALELRHLVGILDFVFIAL